GTRRRRDDPSVDAGGAAAPQDRGDCRDDRALPHLRRDRQACRRELLPAQAVQRSNPAARAPVGVARLMTGELMVGKLQTGKGHRPGLPPLGKSLSARVLLLTIAFVMLGEVLIYAPSAGRFRLEYLRERLATAHVAILALLATPNFMVSDSLQAELMQHAG